MREALITQTYGEIRGALLEDDWLVEFFLHRESTPSLKDAIFCGQVVSHDKNLQWSILDLGIVINGRSIQGFLPAKGNYPPIGKRLLVQSLDHGPAGETDELHRMVKLSSAVQLGAPFLIYTPHREGISLSNKASQSALSEEILSALEVVNFQGTIRQQAQHVPLRFLTAQAQELDTTWRTIQKIFDAATEAQLLYKPDAVARWLWGLKQLDGIEVDSSLQALGKELKTLFPTTDVNIQHNHSSGFDEPIEEAWDTLFDTIIPLPSGARLALYYTPIATLIDIDSGSATGTQVEQLHFSVNMQAIEEILRQMRLRQLSGKVLVDFIPLKHPGFKKQLEQKLRANIKNDAIHLHSLTNLCMAEMVRETRVASLLPQLMQPQINAPTAVTIGYQILRHCTRQPIGKTITIKAHPVIIRVFKADLAHDISLLEKERACTVVLEEATANVSLADFCLS